MRYANHPVWQVGFRPFFALACVAGASLPILWVLMLSGAVPSAPTFATSALQWHAHEMFYGFGWALLGGFLLTSTKNWVGIRGYHGGTLMFLAAAWCFDRVGMALGGSWPPALFFASNLLFIVAIVALLMWTLLRHRAQDSYRDNVYFLLALPLFIPAKLLLLDDLAAGRSMTLALFRLAFVIMLERTLPPFMKTACQLALVRIAPLDHAIKSLALLLVFGHLLPSALASGAAELLALLLGARWLLWQPQFALRRIEVGIMYLGYLAIVAQLLLEFLAERGGVALVGSVSTHVFTVGAIGLIAPAMIVRISRGHTGRKVLFDALDKGALYLMLVGLVARVLAPQVAPAGYMVWMGLAAACWLGCFAILGWRYIPMLLRPRVDGREH